MSNGLTRQKCAGGEVWRTNVEGFPEVLVLSSGMEKRGDVLVLGLIRDDNPYRAPRMSFSQKWNAEKMDIEEAGDAPKYIYAFPDRITRMKSANLQSHIWNFPYPEFFAFQEKIVKWLFGPDAMLAIFHDIPCVADIPEEELKILSHRRWTKAKRELAAVMWDRYNNEKTMERLFGAPVDVIKEKILMSDPNFDFTFDYPIEPENE